MEERESLNLLAGKGIEGDHYFENDPTGKRQVLLLDKSELEHSGYGPGELREQILVDFENLQSIPIGSILKIGNTEIKLTMDCAPCRHMAEVLGEDPQQFVDRMMRKRGMLGIVVGSGTVQPGDKVELLASE